MRSFPIWVLPGISGSRPFGVRMAAETTDTPCSSPHGEPRVCRTRMPRIQKRIQPTGVTVDRALLAKCLIEKPMLGCARLDSLPMRGIRDPTAFQLSTSERPMVSGRQDASTITGGVAAEESVSGISAVSLVSAALLDRWQADPKFPEEPKFGMVPPSTPDRLLFGRDASLLHANPRARRQSATRAQRAWPGAPPPAARSRAAPRAPALTTADPSPRCRGAGHAGIAGCLTRPANR